MKRYFEVKRMMRDVCDDGILVKNIDPELIPILLENYDTRLRDKWLKQMAIAQKEGDEELIVTLEKLRVDCNIQI